VQRTEGQQYPLDVRAPPPYDCFEALNTQFLLRNRTLHAAGRVPDEGSQDAAFSIMDYTCRAILKDNLTRCSSSAELERFLEVYVATLCGDFKLEEFKDEPAVASLCSAALVALGSHYPRAFGIVMSCQTAPGVAAVRHDFVKGRSCVDVHSILYQPLLIADIPEDDTREYFELLCQLRMVILAGSPRSSSSSTGAFFAVTCADAADFTVRLCMQARSPRHKWLRLELVMCNP
jgi:hypothetical protein